MTDPTTLMTFTTQFIAGIGLLGVLFALFQVWMSSRHQRAAQRQSVYQASTVQLLEFFERDAEIQLKLWECYSVLLDSYLSPSSSLTNEELKKQIDGKLQAMEALTLGRAQSLTKCATVLPADVYSAAQDLYEARGQMLLALRATKYGDKYYTLQFALILYQNSFKARKELISTARRLLGLDRLTVEIHELWDRDDSRTSSDVASKLKETVLRRLEEQDEQVTDEVIIQSVKENKPPSLSETPRYAIAESKVGSNGNSEHHPDVA